jgi:hypothetical protein
MCACYAAVWVILLDLVEAKTEEESYLIKMTDCLLLLWWGDWSLETWHTKELSSANRVENRLTWFALQTLVSVCKIS